MTVSMGNMTVSMGNMRPLRAYRRISEQLSELEQAELIADERARMELAQSASRFTRRTQEVVDGTMSLSAALMRAGEVAEANRLLQEVERDVASEEAALIETVNEVKVRGAISRSRITRLKLMKMIAAATMGASLFVFSAFSVAVASFLNESPETPGSYSERDLGRGGQMNALETVRIAGIDVELTRLQANLYSKLTRGNVDSDRLERFLMSVLPFDLASEVQAALADKAETLTGAIAERADQAGALVKEVIFTAKDRTSEAQADETRAASADEDEKTEEGPEPNRGGGEVDPDDDDNLEGIPLPVDNPLGG